MAQLPYSKYETYWVKLYDEVPLSPLHAETSCSDVICIVQLLLILGRKLTDEPTKVRNHRFVTN